MLKRASWVVLLSVRRSDGESAVAIVSVPLLGESLMMIQLVAMGSPVGMKSVLVFQRLS